MTEDRELRRQALIELAGIMRALQLRSETGDQLAGIVLELVEWIYLHCTD